MYWARITSGTFDWSRPDDLDRNHLTISYSNSDFSLIRTS